MADPKDGRGEARRRLELIDTLAAGDGQDWPDFWKNPNQRGIGEAMYGKQADHLLASSWYADLAAARERERRLGEQVERLETRVEFGYQTAQFGWVPEYRGIKYASHQRTVHFYIDESVYIDHWSHSDHRHPVKGCPHCAALGLED